MQAGNFHEETTLGAFQSAQKEQLEDIEIAKLGLINDDDNEVGSAVVHIGVVFKVTVEEADVASHEEDTLELIWERDDQLSERSPYESWSEPHHQGCLWTIKSSRTSGFSAR